MTAFHRRLTAQHLRYAGQPLRVFFDRAEIADDEDWARRIYQGLRSSELFLAFLSPAYLRSKWCKREWEEYLRLEHTLARGDDGIKQIYFVETPGLHDGDLAKLPDDIRDWVADLRRRNLSQSFDLRPWFADGADMLKELDVHARIEALRHQPQSDHDVKLVRLADRIQAIDRAVAQRLDKVLLAGLAQGNLDDSYANFVGRARELRELHTALVADKVGIVAALHGLGGQGKTALAVQYAYAYAGHYAAGGRWLLPCEGRIHLADALAPLVPLAQLAPPEPPRNLAPADARAHVVKSIVDALERRVAETAPQIAAKLAAHKDAQTRPEDRPVPPANALLILDNVDKPELLSAEERASLAARPWLQIIVTTRLDPSAFGLAGKLAAVPVDDLPEADALALLRNVRPFDGAAEADAARKIVRQLGGFTLGVELVGAFLAERREISYADYLERLESEGLSGADALAGDARTAARIRHRGKQIGRIVADTIATLSEAAKDALAYAALFPPDQIPTEWLRAVVTGASYRLVQPTQKPQQNILISVADIFSGRALQKRNEEEAARKSPPDRPKRGYADPWRDLLRDLAGRRLLPPASATLRDSALEMVRLHRLVAEELLEKASPPDIAARRARLRAFAGTLTDDVEILWRREPARVLSFVGPLQALVERLHRESDDAVTALALSTLAEIELRIGAFQRAGEMEEAGNATFRRLYERKASPLAPFHYSTSLGRLGDFYLRRESAGDAEKALACYEQSRDIALGLRRADTRDMTAGRALSAAFGRLYEFHLRRAAEGDDERAYALLTAWQDLLSARSALLPAQEAGAPPVLRNIALSRDIASFHRILGNFYLRRGGPGDLDRAIKALERSAADFSVIQQHENDALSARDVAIAQGHLSEVYRHRGARIDGALAFNCAERCHKLFLELIQANPNDAQAARDLGVAVRRLAALYLWRGEAGDDERALKMLEDDLAVAQRIHDANPTDTQAARDLATANDGLGDRYLERGDLARAIDSYQKSHTIRDALYTNNPDDARATRDAAMAMSKLGDIYMRRRGEDDARDALMAYEESYRRIRRLFDASQNVEASRDLAIATRKLSEVYLAIGDTARAERQLHDVVLIARHFHQAAPLDTEAADDLAGAHFRLARFYDATGDRTKADQAYAASFDILDGYFHRKGRPMSAAQRDAHAELAVRLGKDVVEVAPPNLAIGDPPQGKGG